MDSYFTGLIGQNMLGLYALLVIIISLALGGCVGLERELNGHAAGLRTHIIISLAATLVGVIGTGNSNLAPYIAGGAVISLGFISAGSIVQTGKDVHGITTSSTVLVTGIIGLATGLGYVLEAIIATAVVVVALVALHYFEIRTSKREPTYEVYLDPNMEAADKIVQTSAKYGLKVKNISSKITKFKNQDTLKAVITFERAPNATIKACCDELNGILQPLHETLKTPRIY